MKVKLLIFVFNFIILFLRCSALTVNSFNGIEDLYYFRKQRSIENEDDDPYSLLSDEEKEAMCKKVMNTPYITSAIRNEVYADKNQSEIFQKISKNQELCNFHYEIKHKEGSPKKHFMPKYPYVKNFEVQFKNDARNAVQAAFPCLAENKFTGALVPYYISYGYAEGEGFLYGTEKTGQKLTVLAIIEEAPTSDKSNNKAELEEFYIKQREVAETNPLFPDSDDPVCSLQDSGKARLCAVIFDSQFYAKKVKFMPGLHNTEYECKFTNVNIVKSGKEENLPVRSFTCQTIRAAEPVDYEISSAFDEDNSVFVYETEVVERPYLFSWFILVQEEKVLKLDAYIKNITVLRDKHNDFV